MAKAPCRTNVAMYSADCDAALVLSSYLLLRAAFLRAVDRHKIQNLCSLVLGETMAPLAALVRFSQKLIRDQGVFICQIRVNRRSLRERPATPFAGSSGRCV